MYNKKVLLAAILLILVKSALGIEVEPNNDSAHANALGKENSGKLNRASDVDFFSIDSCVKDDKKQCIKYNVADEQLNPANKAGTDKRREEVSLSFTCNNRSVSTVASGGWFLGIHDGNGELQETYPVKPEDCIINDTNTVPFSFKFPTLDSQNYYVSVVSDCAAPVYNTVTDPKNPTKNIVNVNKFVTAALAKQTDIDTAKTEAITAQAAIDDTKTVIDLADKGKLLISTSPDIYAPSSLYINSNANIQKLTDALALTNDITSLASTSLTPATNISAAISTAKAIEIFASTMRHTTFTFGQFLAAEVAAKDPTIAANIEAADAAIALAQVDIDQATIDAENATRAASNADSAFKLAGELLAIWIDSTSEYGISQTNKYKSDKDIAETAKKAADGKSLLADAAKKTAAKNKAIAENTKKAVENIKIDKEKALTDAQAKYDEAKTKQDEALTALDNAIKSLNDTVKANINAANSAQNLSSRFDSDACKTYNVGIYTLKDNPDNETKRLEYITSNAQKNLGLEQSGQISSLDDMDIYVVDSDGTADVPLLFTCGAMAFRQTNDWKVSIFNDANGLVNTQLINGSSCGSVFIGDKGGQSLKIPKGSPRYYLAVESACTSSTKTNCVVDTSEYSILRDVDKVYSGKLTTKKVDATSADLKLTNCGLNNNAVISIKAENVDLAAASTLTKLPINVQIGSTACRILTPELSTKDALIGTVTDSSKITDSTAKAKDSTAITLADCGSDAKAKVTLTGSRLDLVNLNPNIETDSVVIPIKVNIGDFHCESKEVFAIDKAGGETTYSNVIDSTAVTTAAVDSTIIVDPMTALASAKNISTSQTNKLKSVTEVQAYYVDTILKSDVNFEFSCPNSVRFTNDWALSVYNKNKKLISTQLIDGSACGTGSAGDTGTFKFSALKDSTRSYFVVKSACETGDSVCVVDSSQYQIKRIIPTVTTTSTTSSQSTSNATTSSSQTTAATTPTSTTTNAPCFYSSCTKPITDTPVFGAK